MEGSDPLGNYENAWLNNINSLQAICNNSMEIFSDNELLKCVLILPLPRSNRVKLKVRHSIKLWMALFRRLDVKTQSRMVVFIKMHDLGENQELWALSDKSCGQKLQKSQSYVKIWHCWRPKYVTNVSNS